jgi:integrase
MTRLEVTRHAGIYRVHTRACTTRHTRCGCPPRYQATVYLKRERKQLRKQFDTLKGAQAWQEDARGAVRAGTLASPTRKTVEQAGAELIAGMRDGSIYDRSGRTYKPATIRGYERGLRLHVNPRLGGMRLSDLRMIDVQRQLVEDLHARGVAASTIANVLNPLQVICRRAMHASEITVDPTAGLNLPANRGRRDRIATRGEAEALLDALPPGERALWATAFYGGLRRGELRSLRWSDVNLTAEPGALVVRRTWDDVEGEVTAKSEAGLRSVPLTGRLRALIVEHGLATKRAGEDLVFGRTASLPFTPTTVSGRADRAWTKAGLSRLTPHEARHCCASYLIEAGLNDLELTATIGHSDPRTTKTIYGHLFPDSGATIAAKMDAYLDAPAA